MFLKYVLVVSTLAIPTMLDVYINRTLDILYHIISDLKMKLFKLLCFIDSTFSKPNVILLIADDLGNGDISLNNNMGKIHAPNIDRIGKEGICFEMY